MKNKKTIALAMAAATVAPMAVPAFAAERAVAPADGTTVNFNIINERTQRIVEPVNLENKMRELKNQGLEPKIVGQHKEINKAGKENTVAYIVSYNEEKAYENISAHNQRKLAVETYLKSIKNDTRYNINVKTTEYSIDETGNIVPSATVVKVKDTVNTGTAAAPVFETLEYTFQNVDTKFVVTEDAKVNAGMINLEKDAENEYKELSKTVYELKKAIKKYGLKTETKVNEAKTEMRVFVYNKKDVLVGSLRLKGFNQIIDATTGKYDNDEVAKIKEIPVSNDFVGHWAEGAIVDSMLDGVIKITDKYYPKNDMTRAQFARIICEAKFPTIEAKLDELNNTPNFKPEFKDVAKGDWYAKYVVTLNELGLINGYPDGTFRPDATITRQEAAVVLAAIKDGNVTNGKFELVDITTTNKDGKVIHKDIKTKFVDDAKIPAWCDEAISFLANNEEESKTAIISGYTDGTFRPANKINRAEATMMVNIARPKSN